MAAEKAHLAEAAAKGVKLAEVGKELQKRLKVSALPSVPLGWHGITHR